MIENFEKFMAVCFGADIEKVGIHEQNIFKMFFLAGGLYIFDGIKKLDLDDFTSEKEKLILNHLNKFRNSIGVTSEFCCHCNFCQTQD